MTPSEAMEAMHKILKRDTCILYLSQSPFAVYIYDTELDYLHRLTKLGPDQNERKPPRR
jgi:hypothetical protein